MSNVPNDLKYTTTHEWVRISDDGYATVGVTEHAQSLLGDMVFVDTPPQDVPVLAGEDCCVVESVKAASDVYSPVSGKIVAVNQFLRDKPDLVNSDPYGEGWLFRVQISDDEGLADLLDANAYQAQIAEED